MTAHAATLYWDGTGTSGNADGGSGNWNPNLSYITVPANWSTSATGGTNTAWADNADAVFGGVGGTVTAGYGYALNANSLTFTVDGYTLTGDSLALNGSASITVAGAATATVNNTITGSSGLTKSGAGTLILGVQNNYNGTTTLAGGVLVVNNAGSLGYGGTIDFTGGTLRYGLAGTNDYSNRFTSASNRAFKIDTGGFDVQLQNGFGGSGSTLEKLGSGTLSLIGNNGFSGAVTVTAGTLAVGNAGALGTGTSGVTVASGAALEIRSSYGNSVAYAAKPLVISGTGVGGTGALRNLSANNSYAGAVTLAGDSQIRSDAGTFLISGDIEGSGNTLTVDGAGNTTLSGSIAIGTGGLVKSGAGTLELDGANTFSGTTTFSAGTLNLGNISALQNSTLDTGSSTGKTVAFVTTGTNTYKLGGLAGAENIALGANSLAIGANNATTAYAGALTGTGSLTKNGSGTLTLSGASGYMGTTAINAGRLEVTSLADGGSSSAIGASGNAAANLVLNGGTLAYTGSAAASTDRLFTLQASSTLSSDGPGSVRFTNGGSIAYGTADTRRTITLGGAGTGDNSLAAAIGDNGTAAVSLIKTGVGLWILNGVSTFSGGTSVNGGTLLVNGSVAGGATSVASGATLGGSGSAGAVTLNGGAYLSPGSAGNANAGVFSANSLTWNGGGTLRFNLGASGSDKLSLSGSLIKGSSGTFRFDFLNSTVTAGTYTLITAGSIAGFSASDFSYTNLSGYNGLFQISGGSLLFVTTAIPEPAYAAAPAAMLALVWAAKRRRKKTA